MTLRSKIILLLSLLFTAAGATAWFYHGREGARRELEAATAKEEDARSIVAGVRNSWKADDDWEDTFHSPGAPLSLYTVLVEKALVTGHPLMLYGKVDDVSKADEWRNSIILVQGETRTRGLDLQLSLLSPPDVTDSILGHRGRPYETFVFAAKVNSVEKVSAPPGSSADDYFLARGILYEAEPIGLHRPPHK